MANNDFTRPRFDLSPWRNKDPLTIGEAACLWYELKPGMTERLIELFPVAWEDARSRAADLAAAAKAHRLPIHGAVKTQTEPIRRVARSQYLTRNHSAPDGRVLNVQQGQEVEDWGATEITLADLRAYAESIGERPAFFFPEAPTDSPPTGLGASESVAAEPPKEWRRGIRRVAFDAARAIVAKGEKLTADGLGKAMLDSGSVELKNDEYQLKSSDGNLLDREMTAKPATITGWVTELKKLLKP